MRSDGSNARPQMTSSPSWTSTTSAPKQVVIGLDEWLEPRLKLIKSPPLSLVGSQGVSVSSNVPSTVPSTAPRSRYYTDKPVLERTASCYLSPSHKYSQSYFEAPKSPKSSKDTAPKFRKDSWLARKLHPRHYSRYLEGKKIKDQVIAAGLAMPDEDEYSAIDRLRPTGRFLTVHNPDDSAPTDSSSPEVTRESCSARSRLRKEKSINDKDVISVIKSAVSRMTRRNKRKGEARSKHSIPAPSTARFSSDDSNEDDPQYHDALDHTPRTAPFPGLSPAGRRKPRTQRASKHSISPNQSRASSYRSTSSRQQPPSAVFPPNPIPDRDPILDWRQALEGEMWTNDTPSYAATLRSVSRASTWLDGSDTSSIGCTNDGPSAYEFEVAGSDRVSRSGTTYSGSTAVSSQHHRMSSDAAIASEGGSPKSSNPSKYARGVVDPRSKYSLRSTGKDTRKVPDLRMLDSNSPWHEQDNVVRSMVAV